MRLYPCPVCGYKHRSTLEFGTFEICDQCGWEDDNVQAEDPNFSGGANELSLNEYRKKYLNDR